MKEIKCEVLMISTEKASNIEIRTNEIGQYQHLYFVSDKEINVGDWIIGRCNNIEKMPWEVMKVTSKLKHSKNPLCCDGIWPDGSEIRIEATTDPNLGFIHDDFECPKIPLIPNSFIEKYIKEDGSINVVTIDVNEDENTISSIRFEEN